MCVPTRSARRRRCVARRRILSAKLISWEIDKGGKLTETFVDRWNPSRTIKIYFAADEIRPLQKNDRLWQFHFPSRRMISLQTIATRPLDPLLTSFGNSAINPLVLMLVSLPSHKFFIAKLLVRLWRSADDMDFPKSGLRPDFVAWSVLSTSFSSLICDRHIIEGKIHRVNNNMLLSQRIGSTVTDCGLHVRVEG